MKLAYLLFILLLCPGAFANQLTDAIAKDMNALNANNSTLATASSAGTDASQHYNHLQNDVLPLIQGTKARYQADVQAYNIENAAVKTAIDTHNATRCTQESCVAAYNAEKDRLNASAVQMQSRKRLLDQRHDDLNTMYSNLSTDTQQTIQKIKQARADYDQALADRKVTVDDLNKLQAQSASCKKLLRARGQGTAEALKMSCGNVQFDGSNANLLPPPPDPPAE